jgi:hypothetical protein
MTLPIVPDIRTHLSTGFPLLDRRLQGGYPCGAITILDGHPHAIKTVAAYALASATHHGILGGYLRAADFSESPLFPLELWSTVQLLLFQSLDLLVMENLTPAQLAAMPASIAGLVARRNRTLLITLAYPFRCRAALQLTFTPCGWLYRRQQLRGYRAGVAWRTKRLLTRPHGMMIEIPVPPRFR